ncbi:hypothetical protein THASP1DRAFT_22682, partial [Thamnocephalis sphaerospora]
MAHSEEATGGSGASHSYLNLFWWAFLPDLATRLLQSVYYSMRYPVNSNARPVKGQAKYTLHYKRIYSFVVLAYLAYSVVGSYHQLPVNYYTELNQSPATFTIKDLK